MIQTVEGRSVDPTDINRVIKRAGFDVPRIVMTLRGRLMLEDEKLLLSVPGVAHPYPLIGPADRLEALQRRVAAETPDVRLRALVRVGKGEDEPTTAHVEEILSDT